MRARCLLAVLMLGLGPAYAQAAASVRFLNALSGTASIHLRGQKHNLFVAKAGHVTTRHAVKAGVRTFIVTQRKTVVASLRLRLTTRESVTLVLIATRRGPRLRALIEPFPDPQSAQFIVIDATTAGPVTIQLAATDLPSPLILARGMHTGQWTRPVRVPQGSAAIGWFWVSAMVGRHSAGQQQLVAAGGSVTIFAVTTTGRKSALIRLPWSWPPPSPLTLPAITGTERVGQQLTCSPGVWTGNPTLTELWMHDGVVIPLATGSHYTLTSASDDGRIIGCRVVASTGGGTVTVEASGGFLLPTLPAIISGGSHLPTITGSGDAPGDVLTCATSASDWSSRVPPTFSYAWLRGGALVSQQQTYTLSFPADNGVAVSCQVVATNPGGSSVPVSSANTVQMNRVPVDQVAPTLTDTASGGQPVPTPPMGIPALDTLTCNPGTWDNVPSAFTYVFKTSNNAVLQSGASNVYALAASGSDAGKHIVCVVTASNNAGAGPPAVSVPAAWIQAYVAAPAITDAQGNNPPQVSDHLTCASAVLPASAQVTLHWTSLSNSGTSSNTYDVQATDAGGSVSCTVTAHLAGGTQPDASSTSSTALVGVPGTVSISEADNLSDPRSVDLTCTASGWSGSPTITYQWQKDGSNVFGATSPTLTVQPADIAFNGGHGNDYNFTCKVVATGSGWSNNQSATAAIPMLANPAPSVPASSAISFTQTATDNPWRDTTAVITRAWYACSNAAADASCGAPGSGADTTTTYIPTGSDLGKHLGYRVKATTASGFYAYQWVVAGGTVSEPGSISISESDVAGNPAAVKLTCNPAGWSNSPSYAYSWLFGGVQQATTATYVVPTSQLIGTTPQFSCVVSASGPGWTDNAQQNQAILPQLPGSAPTMSPEPPSLLVAETGASPAWPDGAATLTEHWYHGCSGGMDPTTCLDTGIGGPVGTTTYTPATDLGTYLGYRVKAADGGYYTYDFVFSQVVGP